MIEAKIDFSSNLRATRLINPLGPDGSYMIHRSYGRNNRRGVKVLKLIYQERSISI